MLTGRQIRAARELLGWDRVWFARKAGIRVQTLLQAESFEDEADLSRTQERKIRDAVTSAGVEFVSGTGRGVRLKRVRPGQGRTDIGSG
jgi:hypothetical protein